MEDRDNIFHDRLFGVTITSSNNGIDHSVRFHDLPSTFVDIVGSSNGYLCLYLGTISDKYMIYNPINGESLELSKPTPSFEGLVLRGFGCCPESSIYKLICFSANNCQVLTVGDVNGWRGKEKCSEVFPTRTCMESYRDGVFFQGSVHWIGQSIIVFHLEEEAFQHLDLPSKVMDKGRVHCNLGILEDSLGLVVEWGKDIEIYVMKNYDRAWQLTRVIKDVQFYLDTKVLKHGEIGQLVILHRNQLQIIPSGTNDVHTVKICSATGREEVKRVSAALVFFPTFVSFECAGLITTEQAENEGAHEDATQLRA
jgi:F-box interacting protein